MLVAASVLLSQVLMAQPPACADTYRNCKLHDPGHAAAVLHIKLDATVFFSTVSMCRGGRYALVMEGASKRGDPIATIRLLDIDSETSVPVLIATTRTLGSIPHVDQAKAKNGADYLVAVGANTLLYRLSEVLGHVPTGAITSIYVDDNWVVAHGEDSGAATQHVPSATGVHTFVHAYDEAHATAVALEKIKTAFNKAPPLDLTAVGHTRIATNEDPARVLDSLRITGQLISSSDAQRRIEALRKPIDGGEPSTISAVAYRAMVASCVLRSPGVRAALAKEGYPQSGRIYLQCSP